jgi:ketosteroid isomerase-like protein
MNSPALVLGLLATTCTSSALAAAMFAGASIPALAVMPHRAQHALHHQIEALESQWKNAMLSNSIPEMDHLLAADYIAITPSGTIETKEQVLAARKTAAVRFDRIEMKDTKIRFYGDTAVVTSRADIRAMSSGRDISGRYSYTRVYNHRNGQWQIVSFEASRVRDPDDRAEKR